jgi:hypothetical protein
VDSFKAGDKEEEEYGRQGAIEECYVESFL